MSKPVQTEKGPVKRRFRDKEIEECQGHRKGSRQSGRQEKLIYVEKKSG